MTGLEFENFFLLDKRKYILEENEEFLKWYSEKEKQGFKSIISIEQMQDLINKVVLFYEFKYPNEMLVYINNSDYSNAIENAKSISKLLNFEQLKLRLYHDYIQFFECSYGYQVTLRREKKNLWDLTRETVRVYDDGLLDEYDLKCLKESGFLDDITGITRIEDLYGRYESIDTDVDYSELKEWIQIHKYRVSLRNRILNIIPYAFIYSENTLPRYGYVRAKSFARLFSKEYNVKIDLDEIEEIMEFNYKDTEKVKMLLKENK